MAEKNIISGAVIFGLFNLKFSKLKILTFFLLRIQQETLYRLSRWGKLKRYKQNQLSLKINR
jgi:hypothetical protein